jgi:transposase-like protein
MQADERQAIRECIQLYEKHKDTVTDDLQWLFAIPLQECLQLRYSALRQWIDRWKPIIEKSYITALETG